MVLTNTTQSIILTKQEIKGLQRYTDSVNSLLSSKINPLLENKENYKNELDKLYQKKAKTQLSSTYLKIAKRRRTIGNIVSGVTFLTAFISFQIGITPSPGFGDFSEIYFTAAGVLVLTGQAINIPLKISGKENILKAKNNLK